MPHFLNLFPADGGPALPLTVPASWEEVTLDQFLKLYAHPGALLETLLGIDTETLGRIAADSVLFLANALAFAADPSPLLEQLPTPGLPEVGASPYGLLVLATQHVESLPEGTPGMVAAPYLFALYRCQQLYGKADDAKVEAMRVAVLAEPVTKVYADVAFFLRSWQRCTTGIAPTPKKTPSTPKTKSWMRALKPWGSVSAFFSPSTPSPKALA